MNTHTHTHTRMHWAWHMLLLCSSSNIPTPSTPLITVSPLTWCCCRADLAKGCPQNWHGMRASSAVRGSGRWEDNKEWAQATYVCTYVAHTVHQMMRGHPLSYISSPACMSALRLSVVTHGTLSADKGPLTHHLQGQEGNTCGFAHGKRISSVSRTAYSRPALYGRYNPLSEIMAAHTLLHGLLMDTLWQDTVVSEVNTLIPCDSFSWHNLWAYLRKGTNWGCI